MARKLKGRRVGKGRCESWGKVAICVQGGRYGYSAWLRTRDGKNLAPISVGDARTPAQAMRNAKLAVARVEKRKR